MGYLYFTFLVHFLRFSYTYFFFESRGKGKEKDKKSRGEKTKKFPALAVQQALYLPRLFCFFVRVFVLVDAHSAVLSYWLPAVAGSLESRIPSQCRH